MVVNIRQCVSVTLSVLLLTSFTVSGNDKQPATSASVAVEKPNTLNEAEKNAGWTLLFDGKSTLGWHTFQQPEGTPSWKVVDGTLTVDPGASGVQHGDLATDKAYENYELKFEWKSPENGNSGVFINAQEDAEHPIAWQTGLEYQLLGVAHADNDDSAKKTGEIFGYTSQIDTTPAHGDGQWNQSLIRQTDGKVEFYLNGNLTTRVDIYSEQWKSWVATSRFKDYPAFGASAKGHIVLQEWTSTIYFRNMKLRTL